MKLKYIRPLALALCAVLLCSLFTACSGTSSSSEQPSSAASAASDSASASASTSDSALPDSTTQANTGSLNPGNFDENSAFSITGTTDAFAPCLGWGPGVSGCSLKSVIAAASLLQWAESAHLSSRTPEAIQDAFYDWYDSLSAADQENFAEAWTMIEPDALSLLSDKESMTDLITDAGLDPDTYGYMGSMLSDTFGLRTAGFLTQYVPYEIDSGYFGFRPILDSAIILLSISSYGSDTLTSQEYNVYEVVSNKYLTEKPVESGKSERDTTFYLNFDPVKAGVVGDDVLFTFTFPDEET